MQSRWLPISSRQRHAEPFKEISMRGREIAAGCAVIAVLGCLATRVDAAQCGSSPAGFESWKREFAEEARAKGISAATTAALLQVHYASATIAADRSQRSFGLTLD